MSHILLGEIKQSKIILNNQKLADDRAFSHVLLKYFFDVEYVDQEDFITDGANDGGIDFAYFDEEELKVVVCQSKFTDNLSYADIIAELDKMYSLQLAILVYIMIESKEQYKISLIDCQMKDPQILNIIYLLHQI